MEQIFCQSKFKNLIAVVAQAVIHCIVLGIIIFSGVYFQNWYRSLYGTNTYYLLECWILLFIVLGLCFGLIRKIGNAGKSYLLFFILQYVNFAVYLISVCCFGVYVLALVSSFIAIIFGVHLSVVLFRSKHYFIALLMLLLALLHLCCFYTSFVFCSAQYGVWKD